MRITRARAAAPAEHWSSTLGRWPGLLLALPLLVLLAGFVFYPLVKLGLDSFTTENGFGNYADALSSRAVRKALVTTLVASVGVTVVAVGAGAMLAWYLRSVTSRTGRALLWLSVLSPFWLGTIMKNYAFLLLLGQNGLFNDTLRLVGIGPVEILYTTPAVVMGITYTMIPYAVFAMYGVFRSIDDSLIGAAETMGASRSRALMTVVIPLALPGIVASAALVFAISVGFYVTPELLGGGKTPFMASVIQENLFTYFDYGKATAAAGLLVLVAFVVVAVVLKAVGRERLMRAMA